MDCCSSKNSAPTALDSPQEIDQYAGRLASLITQSPEYQEFIRLGELIDLDPDVKRISKEIHNSQMAYAHAEGPSIEDLQAELETLPAMQAYRKAEAGARDLFHSIDLAISAAAGVKFAPNALQSACG